MGILEIIGELFNPGPIGKIDFNDNKYELRKRFIPLRFVISMLLIGLFEYFTLFQMDSNRDFSHILTVNALLIIYIVISFFMIIKPDYDNLGWVPFLINNPFRFSDNINRLLVILSIFLIPGKYISRSIWEFYLYCKV